MRLRGEQTFKLRPNRLLQFNQASHTHRNQISNYIWLFLFIKIFELFPGKSVKIIFKKSLDLPSCPDLYQTWRLLPRPIISSADVIIEKNKPTGPISSLILYNYPYSDFSCEYYCFHTVTRTAFGSVDSPPAAARWEHVPTLKNNTCVLQHISPAYETWNKLQWLKHGQYNPPLVWH